MKGWCLGTRLLVAGSVLWLAFLIAHVLLAGRWWLWLVVESMPPVVLVLVPVAALMVTPLARPVRHWLAPALVAMLLAGVSLCGVDVRGGGHASFGRHITVFAWSTDIWNSGEDEAAFYRYLRSKDADVYLLQEYLFWSEDAVRIDQYERLRAEFPGHEIRVEGELITLSRFPIVATHPRPVGGGSQWYWHGSKAQRVDVLVNDRVVSVYNVHLQVPLRVEHFPLSPVFLIFVHQQYHSREAELDRLRADVDANPNPVVVVGDFNSAWMDTLIPMGDRLIRHDPTTRSPLLATWPTAAYSAPRWWRFDWLFTTSDVRVNDYRFTRSLSDHTAQEIRISLKEDDHADD